MKRISLILSLIILIASSTSAQALGRHKISKPIDKQEVEINLAAFGKYLEIGSASEVEGVYTTQDRRYIIALVRNKEKTHDYIGVVISADNPYWKNGEVKFNFVEEANGKLKGYYYDSLGTSYPMAFEIDTHGSIKSDYLQKLSVEEVQLGNLASL
ncbi:MAG: hypothetical protein RIC95_06605 [Vicingaceae bacterium]